jgi:hypothetical protein
MYFSVIELAEGQPEESPTLSLGFNHHRMAPREAAVGVNSLQSKFKAPPGYCSCDR